MSKIDPARIRSVLASEGLTAAADTRRKEAAPGALPLSRGEIQEVEQKGWPDMMTRAEVSDWAMNSIREDWRDRQYPRWRASQEEYDPENPDLNLPPRSVLKRFLTEEFSRIRQKGLDYKGYLRVSRAGSEFALNRRVRQMIYLHYLAKTKGVKSNTVFGWPQRYAGGNAGSTKTAGQDFLDALYAKVDKHHSKYEASLNKLLLRERERVEKALLKHDFVMHRHKSYIDTYTDREGIYPEGRLTFIDKRDHYPRSSEEVQEILEGLGFFASGITQDNQGEWSFTFGGK
jgi:hypothetical protein